MTNEELAELIKTESKALNGRLDKLAALFLDIQQQLQKRPKYAAEELAEMNKAQLEHIVQDVKRLTDAFQKIVPDYEPMQWSNPYAPKQPEQDSKKQFGGSGNFGKKKG